MISRLSCLMKCFLGLMMSLESHLHQIMIDDFLSYLLCILWHGEYLGSPIWGILRDGGLKAVVKRGVEVRAKLFHDMKSNFLSWQVNPPTLSPSPFWSRIWLAEVVILIQLSLSVLIPHENSRQWWWCIVGCSMIEAIAKNEDFIHEWDEWIEMQVLKASLLV